MIPAAIEILQRIMDGTLLPPDTIGALDHNAILDQRDDDAEFEAALTRCCERIEEAWAAADIDEETEKLKEDIRRESFLTVSRATTQHEIASYVSDDFDVIARGSILGESDEFLDSLWDTYSRNEVPTPGSGS